MGVSLRSCPVIFEVNTWVWLYELSRKYGFRIDLGNVPGAEWNSLALPGIDAVWLMGVWERSPAGIEVSNRDQSLAQAFRMALPDYTIEDNVGSPYCVRRYRVDSFLGGPEGLVKARQELASRGLSLVLDFVPNHVALDHHWVSDHPEYFIHGTPGDFARSPSEYFRAGSNIIANGKDPYFPAWADVAQLNPFNTGLRNEAVEAVSNIANQCDAIRCDMAMLLLNDIVIQTWGQRPGPLPKTEYWADIISSVRGKYPSFRFIAEVYWDMEWNLQQLGFDYCYDKRLYDRLVHDNAESVLGHLHADIGYQGKLLRFIENHDEPRAVFVFMDNKARAMAVVCCTLPGAVLLHEGQFEGRRVRLPVFLRRRPDEPVDEGLRQFYLHLLEILKNTGIKKGKWQLCARNGWPDNRSYLNIITWCWQYRANRLFVAVNLSGQSAQALIQIPWLEDKTGTWLLTDLMNGSVYERSPKDMASGLYVDLPPWGSHVMAFKPAKAPAGI